MTTCIASCVHSEIFFCVFCRLDVFKIVISNIIYVFFMKDSTSFEVTTNFLLLFRALELQKPFRNDPRSPLILPNVLAAQKPIPGAPVTIDNVQFGICPKRRSL
jgi:hypothetical protein